MIDELTWKYFINALERNIYPFGHGIMCQFDDDDKIEHFTAIGVIANEMGLLVPETKARPVRRYGARWDNGLSPHTTFLPPTVMNIQIQCIITVANASAHGWEDLLPLVRDFKTELVG